MSRGKNLAPDACGALAAPAAPAPVQHEDYRTSKNPRIRQQAVYDGKLIDVKDAASEQNLFVPTAMTAAAYEKCVQVPEGLTGQDEFVRLWDVIWELRRAVMNCKSGLVATFQVSVTNDDGPAQAVELKVCGDRDNESKPFLTVMLADED